MPIILDAPSEVPVQESVQLRNSGSYTIPLEARKAHRLNLTIETISVTRNQYVNLMYNPPQGDFCNVTFWIGDAVRETRKVKYPKEVLADWVNIEKSLAAQAASDVLVTATNMRTIATAQGILLGEAPFTRPFVWAYPITHIKVVCPPDTQVKVICTWWPFEFPPFEFAEPDPNTATPPGGGDEYRSPRNNPSGNPWEGNASASPRDTSRDPRDYGDANPEPLWKVWLVGEYLDGSQNYQNQSSEPPTGLGGIEVSTDPSGESPVQGSVAGYDRDGQPVYQYSVPGIATFGGGWKPSPGLGYRRLQ